MSNPKVRAQQQIVVGPNLDAFHFLDIKGNILGWIDGTGTLQGNLNPGVSIKFADAEIPSGTIDGVNMAFTLINTPTPVSSLQVFYNSALQSPDMYTLNGRTFTTTFAPQLGDSLVTYYRY